MGSFFYAAPAVNIMSIFGRGTEPLALPWLATRSSEMGVARPSIDTQNGLRALYPSPKKRHFKKKCTLNLTRWAINPMA